MAKNCSADVQAVVGYMDQVLTSGDASKIQAFKETFGLGDLAHNDDVASAGMYFCRHACGLYHEAFS